MFGLGMGELVVILLILLLVFGASRIPQIARALGQSAKEFKKAGKESKGGAKEPAKDEKKA